MNLAGDKGFTLIELLVSVGIFAFMTALLVVKYGNFNQSVLLTNLAYDVALTLRTAQTYGLSVKSVTTTTVAPTPTNTPTGTYVPVVGTQNTFKTAFGVHFNAPGQTTCGYSSTKFPMFADTAFDGIFERECGEPLVSAYNLKRGAAISKLCIGTPASCSTEVEKLDVTFRRPNPEAIICHELEGDLYTGDACKQTAYAEIWISEPGGEYRVVGVHRNGQVEVKD